jgi:hypothetical protein
MSSPVVPEQPKPAKEPKAAAPAAPQGVLSTLLGELQQLGAGVGNLGVKGANSVNDLATSITGGGFNPPKIPELPVGTAGQQVGARLAATPAAQAVGGAIQSGDAAIHNAVKGSPLAEDLLNQTARVAGDVGNIAPLAGAAEGIGALTAARTAAKALPTTAENLGLRTAQGTGATLAGSSAGPTLDIQNQHVAKTILGADAGVPHGSPVNPATLGTAREAPGQVLDAGYDQIAPGPLSPTSLQQVLAARGPQTITKPTPNVANSISDIETSLTDPNGQFTGPQLRATRNSLNSDAIAGASSDDADTRTIAAYKRNVVSALDQHVVDSTPPGATITPDQISNARSTLGKNYTLQGLLGKGGDVNLRQLAQMHRDSPNLFTGPTRTVAQFASDHPEVTGAISDANRISPPGLGSDLSGINVLNPRSWVQPLLGAAGRRLLTGPSGSALDVARQTPVAGLGGEFEARPPTELPMAPSPGQVGNAPIQRELSIPPQGSGSQPEGLSAGPMGHAAPSGMPFAQDAGHMAGGLELSPKEWIANFLKENNSDHAAVASQGVPEGIVQRTPPKTPGAGPLGLVDDLVGAGNQPGVQNNASGESPASLEAISRGASDLVTFGQDDVPRPIMKDVTQVDQHPGPGEVVINTKTGQLHDSGNMTPSLARGLLERWKSLHGGLGAQFQ